MSKKLFKNTTVLLIIFFMLFQIVLPSFSNASFSVDSAYIYDKGDCGRHLQYWNSNKNAWYYIVTDFVVYSKDGVEYPAFCLNKDRHGVGTVPAYTVNVTGAVNDQQIWRVITNSYPYKTPQDMGVWNEQDAFVATKQAVYCILYGTDPYSYYKGADSEGEAIKQAIINLVNIGKNGSQTYQEARVDINKTGDLYKDNIGGINYYSQNYNVSSPVELASFDVAIANFPAGTKVFNLNNGEQYIFNGTQTIKISIPELSITTDVNGIVVVQNARCKTTPILFGATPNEEWQNYALTGDPYEIANSNATEQFKGNVSSITINKTDSETGRGITDTEFQLLKDGQVLQTKTTDDNGKVTFSDLYAGNYTVKETRTNDNYVPNNQEQQQSLIYNQNATMNLTNEHKKGTLKINKIDKDNHKIQMGHVLFDVYSQEFDKVIDTVRTDENGEITIPNIRTGTYTLKEKETNKWYTLAPDTDVEVFWEQEKPVSEYTIENEKKKGQIVIYKYDQDFTSTPTSYVEDTSNLPDKIMLEGVKFEIYDDSGNKVQTITTDENGKAISMRLPVDTTYTVKEVETLDNYYLNTETYEVTFNNVDGDQQILNITNEHKKGNAKITKVDKDDYDTKLGAVEFDVYSYEFDTVIGHATTDVNGEISIENLRTGKYQLRETKTNEFYKLAEPVDFEVKDKETTDVVVENEKKKGQVKVIKVDLDNNKIKLQGVKFNVYDKNGKLVDTLTTDENGEATSSKLPLMYNPYSVKEIETGILYELNETPKTIELEEDQIKDLTFENERKKGQLQVTKVDLDNPDTKLEGVTFEIYKEDGTKIDTMTTDENGIAISHRLPAYDRYILKEVKTLDNYRLNNEETPFVLAWNQTLKLTVENEKKKGQIQIYKFDQDYPLHMNRNADTEEIPEIMLEGVKFEIYDKDQNLVDTVVTDKDGTAISKELPIDNIYTVKEVKTNENYILNTETKEVKFKEDKEIQTLGIGNEHEKGNLKVIKVDKDNKDIVLPNAKFDIYSYEFDKVVNTVTTNENGEINIENLRTGKYQLREIEAPEFYNKSDSIDFEVKNNETTILNVEDEKQKGTIVINKTDLDDKNIKLEGVKFEIYDKDQNLVDTVITDKEGIATSKKLPIDNVYTIKEIETADNYYLSNKTYEVQFTEDKEVKTVNITNEHEKGNVDIYKHDSEEEKALQGAEFELTNLTENKLIGKYTTDENGKINITRLRTGIYLLKETKAPEGYKLSKDITFEVKADSTTTLDIAELKIDKPVTTMEVLPKTGF